MNQNPDFIAPAIPQPEEDAHKCCTDDCQKSCDGCAKVLCSEFDGWVLINNVGRYCDSCVSDYQL
jgi:hypothetical protein